MLTSSCSPANTAAQVILTIGDAVSGRFYSSTAIGSGVTSTPGSNSGAAAYVSEPTPYSFMLNTNPDSGTWITPATTSMHFEYTGGAALGDVGATYTLTVSVLHGPRLARSGLATACRPLGWLWTAEIVCVTVLQPP